MPQNKPRRLNEVVDAYAPQGANDRRWFLFEHQLEQMKISLHTIVGTMEIVSDRPENEGERQIAKDCLETCKEMSVRFLGYYASILSYLSDTDVSERISRKEL